MAIFNSYVSLPEGTLGGGSTAMQSKAQRHVEIRFLDGSPLAKWLAPTQAIGES